MTTYIVRSYMQVRRENIGKKYTFNDLSTRCATLDYIGTHLYRDILRLTRR